ncbi:MAG: hypothetical protein ACREM8_01905 [Vulcanimicrobiaceae bacterium]
MFGGAACPFLRDRFATRREMRKSNFALRLQPSLFDEVRKLAETEGVALNQLINVAVAEKLSALRTEDYFRERASRADVRAALAILDRAGVGNPTVPGDELNEPDPNPARPRARAAAARKRRKR